MSAEPNIQLSHLMHYAAQGYGKLINVMQSLGETAENIVRKLRVTGQPSRLRLTTNQMKLIQLNV